jgi:hypothetical protein
MVSTATPSYRHGKTLTAPVTVKGSIELAFEEYLINAGYAAYTSSGNPGTVFSYIHAIKKVLEEEGLSLYALECDIDNIIPFNYRMARTDGKVAKDQILRLLATYQKGPARSAFVFHIKNKTVCTLIRKN